MVLARVGFESVKLGWILAESLELRPCRVRLCLMCEYGTAALGAKDGHTQLAQQV